jgi:hypothetical protein
MRFHHAQVVAAAFFDVLRVRRVRRLIIEHGLSTLAVPVAGRATPESSAQKDDNAPAVDHSANEPARSMAERLASIACELVKLDRYERRALSRRKVACRVLLQDTYM